MNELATLSLTVRNTMPGLFSMGESKDYPLIEVALER